MKGYTGRFSGASEKAIVVDTSGFFVSEARLRTLVDGGASLSTPDLVVFEFTKTVQEEADKALSVGNRRRAEVKGALRKKFPDLLRSLEVEVWDPGFTMGDVDEVYRLLSEGHEPGDATIWVKMRKAGLDTVASADVSDWTALGAKVISLL